MTAVCFGALPVLLKASFLELASYCLMLPLTTYYCLGRIGCKAGNIYPALAFWPSLANKVLFRDKNGPGGNNAQNIAKLKPSLQAVSGIVQKKPLYYNYVKY
jgi:hypothetical protein